ncbi:MAG: T9SS type A sorting domain-containing protein [Saprospiraceae bacterium]|nr:T9SS type A sorting domain-containing protein [Saprospiraceae bacterium]
MMNYILLLIFSLVFHNESASQHFKDQYFASLKNPTNQTHRSTDYSSLPKTWEHLTSSAQIECDLSDLTLTKLDCNDNNQFKVVINFAHQNTTTQFKLYINGEYKGLFPYSQLPITTDYLNGQTNDDYHFLIKDSEFPNCAIDGNISAPYCPDSECHLYNMTYEQSDCDSTGHFNMWLNCNHDNTSDFFDLYIDGGLIGQYAYSQLPINLTQLAGDGAFHVYKFIDINNGDCKVIKEIKHPNCSQGGDCHLYDMTYDQSDCDSTGHFNMWLNCNHDNTSDFFDLYIDGGLIGQYAYSQLPINLTQLVGDGTFHVYKFIDINNGDCKVIKEIKHPNCSQGGDCHLYNMTYEQSDCDSTDHFYMWLNCNHDNTSDFFNLYIDGGLIGQYAYSDLPINLTQLVGDGTFHVYKFIDIHNGDCKVIKEIKHPNCSQGGECNLSELTLTPSNCNSEGQFYVEIDFDYENSSDSFKIQGNGHNYGYFSYEDLPIVLGPFDGNSSTVYEFLVKDQTNPNCKIASHINPPYCQNGFPEPLISMEIYDFKCIDSTNYTAFINVEIRGDANIPVNLYESNKLIGEYNSSAFPIKVNLSKELLPSVKASDKNQPSNFTARLYQHPDCLLGTSNNISSTVKCFPNPTKSGLNIEWSGHHFQYRIHSINGNFIASGQGEPKTTIITDNIPAGAYIIYIMDGKENIIQKFIKL